MATFSLCLFLLLFSYLFLTSNFIMLSQPARQITLFPPFFSFYFYLVFGYSGLQSLSFTEAHFPEMSLSRTELLLFIPAYLSASINPLPVRDQDPSVYHLIIIFGSFPNFSFSALKSIICIICYLHFTSSVIFQHFIFTICPEPQALCTSYAWAHI